MERGRRSAGAGEGQALGRPAQGQAHRSYTSAEVASV